MSYNSWLHAINCDLSLQKQQKRMIKDKLKEKLNTFTL